MPFPEILQAGEDLFHTVYNGFDGVGIAKTDNGDTVARFSVPGPGGPGAQACGECHSSPVKSAAGLAHSNIAVDPDNDGEPPFNTRNTISVFGNGVLQRLAEEMTEELQAIRDQAKAAAEATPGETVRRELSAKGIAFGAVSATSANDEVAINVAQVEGVDPDLVVRVFGWKGSVTNVRSITRGPAIGGMGMQPEEILWKNEENPDDLDPDGDGVQREFSVGDITAMTVYTAGQEAPTDATRLAALGYIAPLTSAQAAQVTVGREAFDAVGCGGCHTPELRLEDTIFEEPTARGNGNYFDAMLAEADPGYDPARPVRFDLLSDSQPPHVEAHPDGGAIVSLYGDLKRHAMGRQLEEPAGSSNPSPAGGGPLMHDGEPVRIAADVFLTPELWGVGNTGPWLHDARAGSLREAILLHGEDDPPAAGEPGRSEAQESRDAFAALSADDKTAVIAFLKNLLTFSPDSD